MTRATGPTARQAAEPYEYLAQVYDRWTAENQYEAWCDFVEEEWRSGPVEVREVLELCCGTGTVLRHLAGRGYSVTGVDRSARMLERAREKLGTQIPLVRAELPELPADGPFDAVLCVFDSVNYLSDEDGLRETLRAAGRVLRPGGTFIFDVNSHRKLSEMFGSSHYGDDLADFAYVWRNRFEPATSCCDFLITLFVRAPDGTYTRHEEHHRQRAYDRSHLASLARSAGFSGVEIHDDYSRRPAGPETLRETWVLTKALEA
ncbi:MULTISPECIES: class I SAM-dependent methyltransferase [unclassified Streptomyces]|uniref:class I SAM-dependent DNA methyltransferase n=1 Tax=unclassified Streptomyces TaxID=2593676 RepID=UPI002DD9DA15|nr:MULTISPECIES: class I SAM-dependent methyltransferase [unclassified Streptomyces]WSA94660.1 class I SAM-dependent methyltransferase [Streptomyces sp. NBC_01795]WSB79079.1 class I SAM-dependent methyltransferase [Streptomyces sp. NBC_01775]WSS12720.1 class I SAM-dependent methyltransferase [Streptomyces sp. NBC_01186]WSS41503.1 class I SAM-dependent methyltransferase [Streptomyces sp. NBC_01187]